MRKYVILSFILVGCLLILTAGCKKKENQNTNVCTWATVFFDDFNRADGPVGANYQVQCSPMGDAIIKSGQLYVTGQFWAVRYILGINDNKLRVSVLLYTTDTSTFYCGVTGKSMDLGDDWLHQQFIMGTSSMTQIGIFKCIDVQPFSLGSTPFALEPGKVYRLTLEIDGMVYKVSIEDINSGSGASLTYSDTTPLAGTIVSLNGAGSQGFFDDFRIEVCN